MKADYLDTNRPDWRTEPIADLVAWTHELTTRWIDVSWLDLQMWVAGNDLRPTIDGLVSSGTAAEKTAAQHILDCLVSGQMLHATDARVRTTINKALPDGPVKTDLLDLAQEQVEHWVLCSELDDMDNTSRQYWLEQERA